jgi:hypothetical protein
MAQSRTIILGLLLMGIGFAAGLAVGGWAGADRPLEVRSGSAEGLQGPGAGLGRGAGPDSRAGLRAAEIAPGAGVQGVAGGQRETTSIPARSSATSTSIPSLGSGNLDGRIEGHVIDVSGAPMGGARLQAFDGDPEAGSTRLVSEVLSDGSGGFSLAVSKRGAVRVRGELAGYRLLGAKGPEEWSVAGERLEFVAEPLAGLELIVIGIDGLPMKEAQIALRPKTSGYRQARQWEYLAYRQGAPLLKEPGSYELIAMLDGQPWCPDIALPWLTELASKRTDVEFLRNQSAQATAVEPLELRLERQVVLYGSLLPSEGQPLPLPYDLALRSLEGSPGETNMKATSFSSPHFQLDAPGPGRYLVEIARGFGSSRVPIAEVEIVAGLNPRDLSWPAAYGPTAIWIRATEPGGAPARTLGRLMVSGPAGGGSSTSVDARYQEQIPGRFKVQLPDEILLETDEFGRRAVCQLNHPRYGQSEIPIEAGQVEYVIEFSEPARFEVRVLGTLPGETSATLTARLTSTGPRNLGAAIHVNSFLLTRDPSGVLVASSSALAVGPYRLEIESVGSEQLFQRGFSVHQQEIELRPGDNRFEVFLDGVGDLLIEGLPPKAFAGVRSASSTSPRSSTTGMIAREDGTATISGLVRGTYVLSVDDRFQAFDFPCGPLRYDPVGMNAVEIRVPSSDSELAALGLASGDRILSIDRQPLTEALWREIRLGAADGPPTVSLRLRRGTTDLDLAVPRSLLLEGSGSNLDLTPTLVP